MTTDSSPQDTALCRPRGAERIAADRLRDFAALRLEAERLEALTAFVARRKAEGGAPTDF
jgi:trimethylamine---corrinoid protein Co-methyltransferase